jgi:hypothetical protein
MLNSTSVPVVFLSYNLGTDMTDALLMDQSALEPGFWRKGRGFA